MENEIEQQFADLDKAVDAALWLQFKYQLDKRKFKVVLNKASGLYAVAPKDGTIRSKSVLQLPENYENMSYEKIQTIRSDFTPLSHWEELSGMISTTHGILLRFLLYYKVPIEKWIRYEVAMRGYDENFNWVGVDQARKIWLKE